MSVNEISIFLEAVGFTWPRDDPKQMTLALSSDNCFEEIQQFLQEENIEQEFVFSQDKAGTQRITNLKTTLKVLKIADNGTIYVLLKSNLDKETPQPEKKPIQKIQIQNKPQQQEPPQEQVPLKFVELDKQQNEFIVNIELNGQVVQIGLGMRGRHGSKIQNIIDQLLMEGIIRNSPYRATLKEENGKEISNDPKFVLQEPQIVNKGRYILSIRQDDIPQEKQPIRDSQGNLLPQDRQEAYYKEVERQKILQAEMERQDRIRNQKLKEDLKNLAQLEKEEQNKNPQQQDVSAEELQKQEIQRQQEQAKKQEEARQQELIKQQEAQRQEQQRQEQQKQEQQRQEQQRQEQLRQEQLKQQEEARQQEAKKQELQRQQDEARRQEELRQQELIKQQQAKLEYLRIQEEARKQEEARIQEEARNQAKRYEEAKQQELLRQEAARQEAKRLEAIRLENIRLEAEKQEAIRLDQIKQQQIQQQQIQQQKLNQKFAMPPVKNDKQIEDESEWSEFIPLNQQSRTLSQASNTQQDQGQAYKKYNSSDQASVQQDLSSFDRLTSSVISQQDTLIQINLTAINFKFKGNKQDCKFRTKITKTIEEFLKSLHNNQTIPQPNVVLHLSKCGKNVLNKSRTFNSYNIDESWVIFASISEEQEEEIEIV